MIIAHRGASSVAPENTLEAFARALEDGADGIEFDVRLASDSVPMVIHDGSLRRTAGQKGAVADLTSKELTTIDVGSWFNRRHRRFAKLEYGRERLPTLEQVLSLIRAASKNDFVAYVELKGDIATKFSGELPVSVCELIAKYRLTEQVVIVSFDLPTLTRVKMLNPAIRTGALFAPRAKPTARPRKRRIIDAAVACGAAEILLHRLMARRKLVELARAAGLRAVVWTVDDARSIARAERLGVHALITNQPAKLRSRQRLNQ